jgi:hypothetical protein
MEEPDNTELALRIELVKLIVEIIQYVNHAPIQDEDMDILNFLKKDLLNLLDYNARREEAS